MCVLKSNWPNILHVEPASVEETQYRTRVASVSTFPSGSRGMLACHHPALCKTLSDCPYASVHYQEVQHFLHLTPWDPGCGGAVAAGSVHCDGCHVLKFIRRPLVLARHSCQCRCRGV
ncbi:unnamed protein product [Ostreobium quekettii]|uniref:Uncharacterized protein n=1 Tax=Ostreobium quekettii TaxID=121088 RepID=A0A8S1JFQ1_9CHLO|nr:unnamed protein product [Ostreobium quekettii]